MTGKPGRPPSKYGKTRMIRVPDALVDKIRAAIAKWKEEFKTENKPK